MSSPDSALHRAFAALPGAFLADQAGDYAAVLQFDLSDAPGRTLHIADGRAWVQDGLVGEPTAVIKSDSATLAGIFGRTVDAQRAFLDGRIASSNLGALMKFSMLFDFGAAPKSTAAPRAWPLGKRYDGGFAQVEPAHSERYAQATNDDSVVYYGPDAVTPPMFHVRLMKKLMFAIATDPELGLDLLRLVHASHDATFHRPLRPWDIVNLRGELLSVEEKAGGSLVVTSRLHGFVDGRLAVEALTTYFVRGSSQGLKKGEPAPESPPPDRVVGIAVASDQSYRYAEASMDDNPIHVKPETAQAAGFPDVILQGLCTMALAGNAAMKALGEGDSRQVRRLAARFSKPVRNGEQLTASVWTSGRSARFNVAGPDGKPVLLDGVVELA